MFLLREAGVQEDFMAHQELSVFSCSLLNFEPLFRTNGNLHGSEIVMS